jgi:thiol-disulfide isomerase/thioredoxin
MNTKQITRLVMPGLLFLLACQPSIPTPSTWTGFATIADGKRIPFTLVLDLSSSPPTASFRNADEDTPVPEVRVAGDSLLLIIAEYSAAFRLHWNGDRLEGRYERYRSDTTGFDVVASQRIDTSRPVSPQKSIPLVGSFKVLRELRASIDSASSAVFWARNDSVFGTIITPAGDDGIMAGTQSGDTVRLSRFTGWQSIYLEIVRDGSSWQGRRFMRNLPPSSLQLVPRPAASLPKDASGVTKPRQGVKTFAFQGITPEGDTLSHTSEKFRGRPLIIDIMGTWCHNCLDAAPILQEVYDENKDAGLEIISLSFELHDNLEAGKRNLSIFRERHGVTYSLLYAGDISAENVEARIGSQLENFGAYPTAIFVDRTGRIVDIHKGFRGPATGEGFQNEIEYFFAKAKEISHDEDRTE